MSAKRGRPPKAESERFTHFDYVRMTKATYDAVTLISDHLGYPASGGRSAAIRYAITKMVALLPQGKK